MQAETSKGCELYIPARLVKACQQFRLTQRERQVLFVLAGGDTWKMACDRLSISESTLKFHVKHLCQKTGAQNAVSALAKVFKVV